jgi:hypothetical protein
MSSSSSSASAAAAPIDVFTHAPETLVAPPVPVRKDLWRFVVSARTDSGLPFHRIPNCPAALDVPSADAERVFLLPPACTFTDACARIADVVPVGDVWALQAPGVALVLSDAQRDTIAGMFNESVLCLSAFQRDDSNYMWSVIQSAPVNQFAWIGVNSALLRGIRSEGRIRDRFACINFSYCLRQERKLQLMNPCYSFITCKTMLSPVPVQEDESDSFADVVFEQKYESDRAADEYVSFRIDMPHEGALVVKKAEAGDRAIAWKVDASRAPPAPPPKLYLPLGPEAERARLQAESAQQLKKLMMLPVYTFSRLLHTKVSNDEMETLAASARQIGGAAAGEPAAAGAGAGAATTASVLASFASKPLFQRQASLSFECAASDSAIKFACEHISAAGIRIVYANAPVPSLGYLPAGETPTKESLGFVAHGSCQGEDMVIADVLQSRGHLVGGTYIDVGCGMNQMSNTSNLYQKAGWRGVCIDMLDEVVREMASSRPSAIAVKAYASRQDGESKTACIPNRWEHRRFSSGPEFEWKDRKGCTRVGFSSRSVWSIVQEIFGGAAAVPAIHLLNITCEGEDAHVLEGSNLGALRPLVVSILFKNEAELAKETEIAARYGYTLARKLSWIAIFTAPQ